MKQNLPGLLWLVTAVHLCIGVSLYFSYVTPELAGQRQGLTDGTLRLSPEEARAVTAPTAEDVLFLSGLDVFNREFGAPVELLRLVLVVTALLSLAALLREGHLRRRVILALLAPQFLIVLFTFYADALIVLEGEFRGRGVSRWAALAGLAWPLLASALHTVIVFERYQLHWVERGPINEQYQHG